jgi:TFIIF-interacting CTD phosphatase-like protein
LNNGKDITQLGRDINKIILVDVNKEVNDSNTIVVSPWKGKRSDA